MFKIFTVVNGIHSDLSPCEAFDRLGSIAKANEIIMGRGLKLGEEIQVWNTAKSSIEWRCPNG